MLLKDCLSSSNKVSSKRVVTLLAFVLMATGFICDLFFDMTISENIYNSMSYIVMAGLGFTASEWMFTSYNSKNVKPVDDKEETVSESAPSYKKGFSVGYEEGYQVAEDECLKGDSLDKESDLK